MMLALPRKADISHSYLPIHRACPKPQQRDPLVGGFIGIHFGLLQLQLTRGAASPATQSRDLAIDTPGL